MEGNRDISSASQEPCFPATAFFFGNFCCNIRKVSTTSMEYSNTAQNDGLVPQALKDKRLQEIWLTSREEALFDFLRQALEHSEKDVKLRVAGGWVRNKLLGLPSDDLDIVSDTLSGEKFALLVKAYQQKIGMRKSTFGIIQSNPDQSKHLETVVIKLFGLDIDLNQLRSDSYANESRIPQVCFPECYLQSFSKCRRRILSTTKILIFINCDA